MIATYLLLAPLWLATPDPQAVQTPPPAAHFVLVTGNGRAPARATGPQTRLMAKRAAEIVALRNLSKELGLASPASLSGFRYVSSAHHADGSVTVTVEWRSNR